MDMEQLKLSNTHKLARLGIEVPNNLPQIEPLEEVSPRSSVEVASRLCALSYVIALGFGAKGKDLKPFLDEYDLMDSVTDHEKSLLDLDILPEQERINASWLPECAQALAWCINLAELNHFDHCDNDLASKIPFKSDPGAFISNAALKPLEEIQQQSDLLYRMHWYARDCTLNGVEGPLNEGIISRRRKAIDWVYGVEEDWDEVPIET